MQSWVKQENVHGDIRHLEKSVAVVTNVEHVHGDIRHLENPQKTGKFNFIVHGDIRHLEKQLQHWRN